MVQKGDLLLRIDPVQTETEARAQKSAVEIAQGDANNQQAQISLQQANVDRDRSSLHVAETELLRAENSAEIAEATFKRKQELFEQNLISRDLYDAAKNELLTARTLVTTSKARVEQAKSQLAVTQVMLEQTRNSFKSAQSRVAQNVAYLNRSEDLLTKTVIRSPLKGVITKLNVEKGERAVPGTLNSPSATLMEIADLSVIEAEVQVDETDIVNVKVGQDAEVKVDALRDEALKGKVTEVGNSAIQALTRQTEAKDFKVVVTLEQPPSIAAPRPELRRRHHDVDSAKRPGDPDAGADHPRIRGGQSRQDDQAGSGQGQGEGQGQGGEGCREEAWRGETRSPRRRSFRVFS